MGERLKSKMMVSVMLLFVALVAEPSHDAKFGGICPFKRDAEAMAQARGIQAPPHFCNVSIIGSNLCACFGTDHCSGGCGCLVPTNACSASACAFPRVCFCEKIGGQTQNGANCSPVNSGPCTICQAKKREIGAAPVHTPRKVLQHEFARLSDPQLVERLDQLELSSEGTTHEKIERLIDYVVDQELKQKQ